MTRRRWNTLLIVILAILIAGMALAPRLLSAREPVRYKPMPILADPFGEREFGQPMTPYALILRSDGTVRRALVSSFTVDALREGKPIPTGSTFAVEVVDGYLNFGFVDVRQKLARGWEYGRFDPKAVDFSTRRAPQECNACHLQSNEADRRPCCHV
jgi:hypothetical protein